MEICKSDKELFKKQKQFFEDCYQESQNKIKQKEETL
jgi:hypothetical protein